MSHIPTKTDILNKASLDASKKTLCKMIINKKYHERIGDKLAELYNSIDVNNFDGIMKHAHELCNVIDDENSRIVSYENFRSWGKITLGGALLYTTSKFYNIFFQQNMAMNIGQQWGIGVIVLGVIMTPFSWITF